MRFHLITFAVVVVLLAVQIVVFLVFVWPRVKEFRTALGAGTVPKAAGVTAWAGSHFLGIKHSIAAMIGTLALSLPDLFAQLKIVDWTGTTVAQYAPMIGLVCIMGMMMFNAVGLRTALHATPPVPATTAS